MKKRTGLTFGRAICGVLMMFSAVRSQAQTESVIFNFDGPISSDTGCSSMLYQNTQPRAGLFFRNNRLFGTTPSGGAGIKGEPTTRDGTVFRLTIPSSGDGTKTVLHSFIDSPYDDGVEPCSKLIGNPNGAMFGTTVAGGDYGAGTIFRLILSGSNWTEQVIYNFNGTDFGGQPLDGLVRDSSGNLYGATSVGGIGNNGLVFELSPQIGGYIYQVLYSFTGGSDGYFPNGDLLFESSTGKLFGTTYYGGTNDEGTVFSLTPTAEVPWSKTTLWSFDKTSTLYSAANPNGGLVGGTGALFGTTQYGGTGSANGCCGTVFFLWQENAGNPVYTFVPLHDFAGGSDGAYPTAGLLDNPTNTFWGTTTQGGTNGSGTVFELYPDPIRVNDWHYKLVYSFLGGSNDGATPESPLTMDSNGNLYGTTNAGGTYNLGTAYKITP